jgi:hypothetical protein
MIIDIMKLKEFKNILPMVAFLAMVGAAYGADKETGGETSALADPIESAQGDAGKEKTGLRGLKNRIAKSDTGNAISSGVKSVRTAMKSASDRVSCQLSIKKTQLFLKSTQSQIEDSKASQKAAQKQINKANTNLNRLEEDNEGCNGNKLCLSLKQATENHLRWQEQVFQKHQESQRELESLEGQWKEELNRLKAKCNPSEG